MVDLLNSEEWYGSNVLSQIAKSKKLMLLDIIFKFILGVLFIYGIKKRTFTVSQFPPFREHSWK
jgi:hypothetical protein